MRRQSLLSLPRKWRSVYGPLFWVYDRFFFFLKCQPERAVEKGESCCRGAERERERERVHFQSLFVLFSDNVLGAGKSLKRRVGWRVNQVDR